MTKTSRLKFILGIVLAFLSAFGLTLYLQDSMSKSASIDAQLDSDTYTVGVGYSGIIEEQFVNVDDYIKKGDPLFSLRSPTLLEAIKNDEVSQSSLLYETDAEGRITITASVDGQIREIIYKAGAFVPANSEIAVVNTGNSLFVTAVYKLSGPDYGRISKETEVSVKLPDNKVILGKVRDFKLETKENETLTTVTVRLNESDTNDISFSPGTPVQTTLYLNGQTWYEKIKSRIL